MVIQAGRYTGISKTALDMVKLMEQVEKVIPAAQINRLCTEDRWAGISANVIPKTANDIAREQYEKAMRSKEIFSDQLRRTWQDPAVQVAMEAIERERQELIDLRDAPMRRIAEELAASNSLGGISEALLAPSKAQQLPHTAAGEAMAAIAKEREAFAFKPLLNSTWAAINFYKEIQEARSALPSIMRQFEVLSPAMETALRSIDLDTMRSITDLARSAYLDAYGEALPDHHGTVHADTSSQDPAPEPINLLTRVLLAFWANTKREASEIGAISFLNLLGLLAPLILAFQPSEPTNQSQMNLDAVVALNQRLEQSVAELSRAVEAETKDLQALANLSRFVLERKARLRTAPSRNGELIITLHPGTEIAIAERQGNWARVFYRSDLTKTLETGWVYKTALQVGE